MNPSELDLLLVRSLEDQSLSRSERQALRDYLKDRHAGPVELALVRQLAFAKARALLADPSAGDHVFEWLEDVVKLLQHLGSDREATATSEAYFAPWDNCAGRIVRLIEDARRQADVCVFTITDDRIADALREAHQRGLAVRIISDREKAADPGSDIERLRVAGIHVRIDPEECHMHHKYALFDGHTLVTGSYNWTRAASLVNKENLIVTSDPYLVGLFERNFQRIWESLT